MGRNVKVRRISGTLGAEIEGVDLARPLPESAIAELRALWLEHLVLFFRDQALAPRQFLALARSFGEAVEYPFLKGLADAPEVVEVLKREHETVNFGGVWHSDTAYLECPPMATMLIAREIPPHGGDTMFANGYLAYEALPEGLRERLKLLRAVNSSAKADVSRTREDRLREKGSDDAGLEFTAEHPVARIHPETGRAALYVNPAHTVRFAGMTEEESAPLLDDLFRHQVRPEFTSRFAWSPGAIALWDNRCTLHFPVNDYHGHRRLMHRVTLAGDVPRGYSDLK